MHFFDIWTSKNGPKASLFTFWLGKCASRHRGMHLFNISTSETGLRMWCFAHFHLEIRFGPLWSALFRHRLPEVLKTWSASHILTWTCCLAPQRRALFGHLNFQKWSENVVPTTFWLGNMLRATGACTFSTSQIPQVLRTGGVLHLLTWTCTSRHNGVQFFDISTSTSFPTLLPFRTAVSSLLWLSFLWSSLLWLSLLWLDLLTFFSASSHLWFSSVHTAGGLTSKQLSIRYQMLFVVQ